MRHARSGVSIETLNVATPSASSSLMAERYCGASKAERDEDSEAKGGDEGGDEGGEEKDAGVEGVDVDTEEDADVEEVEDDVEEEVVEAGNNAEEGEEEPAPYIESGCSDVGCSCRTTLHHHARARACTRSRKNRKMGLSRVWPNGIWYVSGVAARTTE